MPPLVVCHVYIYPYLGSGTTEPNPAIQTIPYQAAFRALNLVCLAEPELKHSVMQRGVPPRIAE